MSRATKTKRTTRTAVSTDLELCHLDPLLVGADREFLDTFPKEIIREAGALPIRRYRGAGFAVAKAGTVGEKGLKLLQKECDIRLTAVPAMHDYGVDLFVRYWEGGGDHETLPPLWVPSERRAYLHRLGDMLSGGRLQPGAALATVILTSPLASKCPLLVAQVGNEGLVYYFHGAAGLKVGARFPAKWLATVVDRLRLEFEMETTSDLVVEGRGKEQRGLNDLAGFLIPPLKAPSFIIEPRLRR